MSFATYINVEPVTGVRCELRIDDGTIREGIGQQHIEFHDIPDNLNGWGGIVTASADGYKTAPVRVSVQPPAMTNPKPPEGDGGYVFIKLEKAAPARLTIAGGHFRNPDGSRWQWRMCDYYRGLAELRDRGEDYFRNRIRYFTSFGFVGCRIYFAGTIGNTTHLFPLENWPMHFALVNRACQIMAEEGFIPEWTGGDYQVVLPTEDQQVQAHSTMRDILRGYMAFYDWCNEAFKNGGIRSAFDRVDFTGVFCTYGHPFQSPNPDGSTPAKDYHAFASTREYPKAYTGQSKMFWYGAGMDESGKHYDSPRPVIDQEPIGAADFSSDKRSNDPNLFRVMAAASIAYGDGLTFHDDSFGSAWTPRIEECARACIAGFQGAA